MSLQFRCYYCDDVPWINKENFDEHMRHHRFMGDDVSTIKIPNSWDEFVRRFGAIGLCDLREV